MLHASPRPFILVRLARCRRADDEREIREVLGTTPVPRHRIAQKLRAVRREFDEKEKDPARAGFSIPSWPDRVSIPTSPDPALFTKRLGERGDRSVARHANTGARLEPPGMATQSKKASPSRPVQAHLLTPGSIARQAPMSAWIPAPIVAQFCARTASCRKERFEFTAFPAHAGRRVEQGGTLVSALVAFKRLHDDNALLDEVMPEFCKRPNAIKGARLRDLCAICTLFSATQCQRLQRRSFARTSARNGDDAARGFAATRAQQCRLFAIDEIEDASRPRCSSSIRRA